MKNAATPASRTYEAPKLIEVGSFRKLTGLLMLHGNDRLILSKN